MTYCCSEYCCSPEGRDETIKDCQNFSTRILHIVILTFVLSLLSVEARLINYCINFQLTIFLFKEILLFNFSIKYYFLFSSLRRDMMKRFTLQKSRSQNRSDNT